MDFAEWMKAAGLSEGMVRNHLMTISGRLTNWAWTHGLTTKPILEIWDLSEFVVLAEQLRQTPEFRDRNASSNGKYAVVLGDYEKYLRSLVSPADTGIGEFGPCRQEVARFESELGESFDPKGEDDGRAHQLHEVVQRRGDQRFRKTLITAYGGHCAITGCAVVPLLEAVHVTPYLGPDTNSVMNGLLLRADLHTMWDLGLVAVDPATRLIWVSPKVDDPAYQALSRTRLAPPRHPAQQPSFSALQKQWAFAHSKLEQVA